MSRDLGAPQHLYWRPNPELFHQALGNAAGAIVLESLVLTTGMGCQIASQPWKSRFCWPFTRDRGLSFPLPYHSLKVYAVLEVPFLAHSISCFIVAVLGLLYLGSSTASTVWLSRVSCCCTFHTVFPSLAYSSKARITHPIWTDSSGSVPLDYSVTLYNWDASGPCLPSYIFFPI